MKDNEQSSSKKQNITRDEDPVARNGNEESTKEVSTCSEAMDLV